MFEIGKTYKIAISRGETVKPTIYTITIDKEDEDSIGGLDRDVIQRGVMKSKIIDWNEIIEKEMD